MMRKMQAYKEILKSIVSLQENLSIIREDNCLNKVKRSMERRFSEMIMMISRVRILRVKRKKMRRQTLSIQNLKRNSCKL